VQELASHIKTAVTSLRSASHHANKLDMDGAAKRLDNDAARWGEWLSRFMLKNGLFPNCTVCNLPVNTLGRKRPNRITMHKNCREAAKKRRWRKKSGRN